MKKDVFGSYMNVDWLSKHEHSYWVPIAKVEATEHNRHCFLHAHPLQHKTDLSC